MTKEEITVTQCSVASDDGDNSEVNHKCAGLLFSLYSYFLSFVVNEKRTDRGLKKYLPKRKYYKKDHEKADDIAVFNQLENEKKTTGKGKHKILKRKKYLLGDKKITKNFKH